MLDLDNTVGTNLAVMNTWEYLLIAFLVLLWFLSVDDQTNVLLNSFSPNPITCHALPESL